MADGTIKIYSRNAENLTPKYPDVVRVLPTALKNDCKDASFVLDAEAVAYDVERKQVLPFQELQTRKRKDVLEANVKVQVCIFVFDLLFFDGKSLLLEPLSKRREVLMSSFCSIEGIFMFAEGHDSRDPEEIMDLLNDSVKAGCEGLMVKALEGPNATYEPANRSQNWLKVKKDYLDGLGDTLDLVPIGGFIGRGRRTGTYGGFLLACYDPENEEFQTVCKIGTGFTDEDLENISSYYNDKEENRLLDSPKSYYRFSGNKGIEPDVWFEPCQVWEVKCADLSISPAHTAAIGQVDPAKGIALRFPRYLRLRDDKGPDDATTSDQVSELYSNQSSVTNNK
jgi:DNA ligase 1